MSSEIHVEYEYPGNVFLQQCRIYTDDDLKHPLNHCNILLHAK